jgi:thioredoxin-related protein
MPHKSRLSRTVLTTWVGSLFLLAVSGCGPNTSPMAGPMIEGSGIQEYDAPAGVDGRQWLESYDQAIALAKENQRPILVDFTGSDWCGWCIRLDEEVFSKAAFQDWAQDHVVLLKLDFPQTVPQSLELVEQNQQLAQQYGVQGFPTILFLSEGGKVLGSSGYLEGGPSAWIQDAQAKL